MGAPDLFLIAVAGLAAGAINAMAGGGSLISFPALVAAGLPPLSANVTNTTALWPGYVGSTAAYRHEVRTQGVRLRRLAVATVLGAVAGSVALLAAPEGLFDAVVPVLVAAASILLALQPRIARVVQGPSSREAVAGAPSVPARVAVGLAGAYGAYFGGGLGVILLAVLGIWVPEDLQRLNGMKMALSAAANSVALVAFALFGPVDWVAVAVVAPASLVGGYLGARAARRLDPDSLRRAIVLFGLVMALWLFAR